MYVSVYIKANKGLENCSWMIHTKHESLGETCSFSFDNLFHSCSPIEESTNNYKHEKCWLLTHLTASKSLATKLSNQSNSLGGKNMALKQKTEIDYAFNMRDNGN